MEGDWNGTQGPNKYQYNGKEWNDDFGLGWNDYGRRFYDPAVGRFFVLDRFAEKYHDFTPYKYAGNNPIKFIDINGDSIGVQNEGSNHVSREAFATFASTKEGINYLSQFAKVGQVIAGHTYNKDGKYHQKGLNLHFKYENLKDATRGVTRLDDNNNITVVLDTDSKFIAVSDKGVHAYTGSATYTEALFSKIVTLSHETFLHAELSAQDYLQDSKFNNSNIGKDILGNLDYTESDYQHMQVYNNSNSQIFPGSSLKVATEANTILKLNFSPTQMEGIIWNYSGGNTTKMKK
jgi:RHS repeat-associated protein